MRIRYSAEKSGVMGRVYNQVRKTLPFGSVATKVNGVSDPTCMGAAVKPIFESKTREVQPRSL